MPYGGSNTSTCTRTLGQQLPVKIVREHGIKTAEAICTGDQTERITGSLEQLGCLRGLAKTPAKKKAEARLRSGRNVRIPMCSPGAHLGPW